MMLLGYDKLCDSRGKHEHGGDGGERDRVLRVLRVSENKKLNVVSETRTVDQEWTYFKY